MVKQTNTVRCMGMHARPHGANVWIDRIRKVLAKKKIYK